LNLVKQKPEVAVKNKFTGGIWRDRKGISWVDPASKFVWDYNIEVSKEAIKLGVDEINFDYIRFPSDGDMKALAYPVFDENQLSKSQQLEQFFKYLNENLKPTEVKLSVDLFGLSTVNNDDLGIGQKLNQLIFILIMFVQWFIPLIMLMALLVIKIQLNILMK